MSIFQHRIFGDNRGKLVAIEGQQDVPFEVKRVFYIFGVEKGMNRGQHAHHQTKQYLIAVSGSCKVTLDDGMQKTTYELNQPNMGLMQDALVWGTMHEFTSDCVLVVMASEHFNDADYIRDYEEFLKVVGI